MTQANVTPTELVIHHATQQALDTYKSQPTHAILLEGSMGLGKTHIAKDLASALLGVPEDKIGTHPYVQTLTLEKQVISIEQVRSLHAFYSRKVPGTGRVKRVVIIPDSECMTIPAQNALLKLLEEPPSDTVCILTSSASYKLLPTILSRVQKIAVHTPKRTDVLAHYAGKHSEETVTQAMFLAGDSISRLDALLSGTDESGNFIPLVKQVLAATAYERLILLKDVAKDKKNAIQFVDTLAEVIAVSLESGAAKRASTVRRWQQANEACYQSSDALRHNGNTMLVMTELALYL